MITKVKVEFNLESLRPLDQGVLEEHVHFLLMGEDTDNFFEGESGYYAIALPDIKVEMEEV